MPIPHPTLKILILVALPLESRAILRFLRRQRSVDNFEIRCVGMRAIHLAQRVSLQKLAEQPPAAVLIAGVGGGLDPSLEVGDVVIDGATELVISPHVRTGMIHTADRIALLATTKAALYQQTSALAVDMEQEIVRRFFAGSGFRVIGIRAISDPADLSLPGQLEHWVDPVGRSKPLQIARDILAHPRLVPQLLSMRRDLNRALESLVRAVARIVDHLTDGDGTAEQ